MMEALHINGHSIKFVDRKLWKREESYDSKLDFSQRLFIPFHSVERRVSGAKGDDHKSALMSKRKCPEVIDGKARKRRILKRPKVFKNYYTDRKPLSIPCFEFPRFGVQFPFRGRQTICKYYDHNELINEQLIQIKSARTVQDFERIFSEQLRHNQQFAKGTKSIEPYYDTKAILAPSLRPFASETCLCSRDNYRLGQQQQLFRVQRHTQTPSPTPNAIRAVAGKHSLDDFLHLASECYDKCIQCYLSNLDECTRRVEKIESHSASAFRSHSPKPGSAGRRSLRTNPFNENALTSRFNRLSINLDASRGLVSSDFLAHSARQSAAIQCSQRAMSCNDSNNNSTDSTNQTLKDPPKIIFSDFSTNKQAAAAAQVDTGDSTGTGDKNCLSIPINSYCSEARPP